jgi:glycosyltransferase involved in cell wall biosynthesis
MALEALSLAPGKPLRLVHIVTGSGPDAANGVVRVVYHVAKAQRALGHDVGVVSERGTQMSPLTDTGHRSPLGRARNRFASATRQISPTLAQEILAHQPDIVHMHSIHVPENVSLARYLRRAGVNYCVTVHGGLSRTNQRRGRAKKRAFWWMGEREYLNGALFIHALTCEEADDIAAYGVKTPTIVAPNGIDADSLPLPRNPKALYQLAPGLAGRRVFVFMGRVALLQKGLDLLIQGFSLAKVPDSRLVVLGPDWRNGRACLEQQVDNLGLRSQVLFLDGQPPQRCADLVAGADVFVHTSRWEGMALSVLEAAAWQKPCLLTRMADPNGTIGRAGGAIVVDATAESIASGLRTLATIDRRQLMEMGRRARSAVSQFKWSLTADTLLEAYRHGLDHA